MQAGYVQDEARVHHKDRGEAESHARAGSAQGDGAQGRRGTGAPVDTLCGEGKARAAQTARHFRDESRRIDPGHARGQAAARVRAGAARVRPEGVVPLKRPALPVRSTGPRSDEIGRRVTRSLRPRTPESMGVLAVLRFTAISYFVGNCTGRSP